MVTGDHLLASNQEKIEMVKQCDEHGHFLGTQLRAICGSKIEVIELLGESIAYIEHSNLTSRTFNVRQTRKTLHSPKKSSFTKPLRF